MHVNNQAPAGSKPRRPGWRDLFSITDGPSTPEEVVAWWEARRWPYNTLLACLAPVSFFIFFVSIIAAGELKPGEDAVEPLALPVAAILGPLFANLCYTLG